MPIFLLRSKTEYDFIKRAAYTAEKILGIKPYPTQIECAIGLIKGQAVEMQTGEGKTLSIALAVPYLVRKGKVYVVTVNKYLAQRDWEYLRDYYAEFNIKSAVNTMNSDKGVVYGADVIYTSAHDLVFDYLFKEIGQLENIDMPLNCAILDEIDFILIDSANHSFSVSLPDSIGQVDIERMKLAYEISLLFKGRLATLGDLIRKEDLDEGVHYIWAPHIRQVYLTESGHDFINKLTGINLHEEPRMWRYIIKALEARHLYRSGKNYIVKDNKIILINRYNGRVMPNSYLESELHTMIEIKENADITAKPRNTYNISYPVFFMKFQHLCGVSGTVMECRNEFAVIYGLGIKRIKPYRPKMAVELPFKIFKTKVEKYRYIIEILKNEKAPKQPALIVCSSDLEARIVHRRLLRAGIKNNILTSEMEDKEPDLLQTAGKAGQITVTTIMCSRGTDIIPDDEALKSGGLLVIATSYSMSRRIDRQIAGRTARQGQPGVYIYLTFFLQDELFYYSNKREADYLTSYLENRHSNREGVQKTITQIQERVQANLEASRILNIKYDAVIENYRTVYSENIKNFKEEFLKALKEGSNTFWELCFSASEDRIYSNKEELINAVNGKYREYGPQIFEALLEKLIKLQLVYGWVFYKRVLNDEKEARLLNQAVSIGKTEKENYTEFIKESGEMVRSFIKEAYTSILFMLLSTNMRTKKGVCSSG